MPMKKGIAAAGNWIVDWVKVIDAYPAEERLANVLSVTRGGGGGAHNVLIGLARMKAPFPLYGIGFVGNDDDGRFLIEEAKEEKIDFSGIRVSLDHPTSFTDVMTVESTGTTSSSSTCPRAPSRSRRRRASSGCRRGP